MDNRYDKQNIAILPNGDIINEDRLRVLQGIDKYHTDYDIDTDNDIDININTDDNK